MKTVNDASLTISFPSDVEMLITRTFAAPCQLLFAAITKPEHVRNWYGPSSLTLVTCEIDLRVGGKWRYVLQAPDGSEHAFSGEYLELAPPERLVSTEWYEAIPGAEYVATVTLAEVGGKTTLTNLLRYKSKEHRDGHVASGMEGGMRESYERLDEQLAVMATAEREIGTQSEQKSLQPNPDLKRLDKLVGSWQLTGGVEGTVTYAWMEGGFFLIQHIDLGKIKGMEIIGHLQPFGEAPSAEIKSRYYGSRGETFDYVYEMEGDTLIIWGGEKGSPAYFKGIFTADGNSNSGAWTYPGGGGYESIMTRIN